MSDRETEREKERDRKKERKRERERETAREGGRERGMEGRRNGGNWRERDPALYTLLTRYIIYIKTLYTDPKYMYIYPIYRNLS